MGVDRCKGINRHWILTTDQNPIRGLEIAYGRSFRQKFRIGEHRKGAFIISITGCLQDGLDCSSRAHRQGAFLDDDGMTSGRLSHLTCTGFYPAQITGLSSSQSLGLGGRVHRNEHHVCSGDRRRHIRGEMQVAPPRPVHNTVEPRFIHGQLAEIGIIPGIDTCLVDVHHLHLNLRTAISDDRHGRAAYVAGTDAADPMNSHVPRPWASPRDYGRSR